MSATALAPVAAADVAVCRTWIAEHSKSFHAASLILPRRVREASWALYAFCRRADDAVDEIPDDASADARAALLARRVASLRAGVERVYTAVDPAALADPIDRAYASVAARHGIPRAVAEELVAGMEMDARGARYATWDDLYLYCFRVASTVGLMMTAVMRGDRELRPMRHDAWARAADLGLAMQLTNIARDVGEDARRGRVYLPDELLAACGTTEAEVLATGQASRSPSPPIREAVRRLLARADEHYRAADRGVPLLPWPCRPAIAGARNVYSAIGAEVAKSDYDSVTTRAHTSTARKLVLLARALPSVFATPGPVSVGPADDVLVPLVRRCGLPG